MLTKFSLNAASVYRQNLEKCQMDGSKNVKWPIRFAPNGRFTTITAIMLNVYLYIKLHNYTFVHTLDTIIFGTLLSRL